MKGNAVRMIAGFFAISLLIPFAFGFNWSSLFGSQNTVVCVSDKSIDTIMNKYNNTYISKKLLDFAEKNNYNNAIVKIKKGRCTYEYAVKITDSGQVIINCNIEDDYDIEISMKHNNLVFADKAYGQKNSMKLLAAGIATKMPWKIRFNAILFLKSYL